MNLEGGFKNETAGLAPAKWDLEPSGNNSHNVFDGTDKIYEWLNLNGPRHGFVRTVSNESWHWEYRPADAPALLAAGRFKMDGVEDRA